MSEVDNKYENLEKYGEDLVKKAKEQKIDPIIGRDSEIRNVIRILNRRTKNNPVLIGEPGVGKTAAVEGLAQRIADGNVPEKLKRKKIFSLDIAAIIAGATFHGQFQDRFKAILNEVKQNPDVILFIDEIHMIVGAGGSASSPSVDASNMLKPMLARGELHCIGATTLDEHREYIESDPALERRFQPVLINEPSIDDTIAIIRGLKEKYELYHGVMIEDKAIIAAVEMSSRYIQDRFLPDKALDLIDEACAWVKTEQDTVPVELDELEQKITQLKIEKSSMEAELKYATHNETNERYNEIEKKIEIYQKELSSKRTVLEEEKSALSRIQQLRERIDQVEKSAYIAYKNDEFNKVAQYRQLRDSCAEKINTIQNKRLTLLRNNVSEDEVGEVVSKWTGIPVSKLTQSEKEKLVNLEDDIKVDIIGQDEAVKQVVKNIKLSKAGIKDPNKPIGSFLFMGTTGVGKTALAKALAKNLFDDYNNILRFDMSEYAESVAITKLIGSAPGYVGYEEGGTLTEAVRRKPYCVILFDEIEKAHPNIFNLLLQVLDEGHLTDSKGRLVNFKNTIIIMTSNVGAQYIAHLNDDNANKLNKKIENRLRETFPPEFLNRIDSKIVFNSLSKTDMVNIAKAYIRKLNERLENEGIEIEITDDAILYLVDEVYAPEYGARPIERQMKDRVEYAIADLLISGKQLSKIKVYLNENDLRMQF